MTPAHLDLLLETCLLAGKIMIESDAEMYRVEDTMSRMRLLLATIEWLAM